MRCLNKIYISGEVVDYIHYGETPSGTKACTFYMLSQRPQFQAKVKVKVNIYGDNMVRVFRLRASCEDRTRLLVEGELMNRTGDDLVTVEIRAHEIFFQDGD